MSNRKYSPYVSSLYALSNSVTLDPAVTIDLATLFPAGTLMNLMQAGTGNPTYSQYWFQAEDRPLLETVALWCNYADGLLQIPIATRGGATFAVGYGEGVAPVGYDRASGILPALNTEFEIERSLTPFGDLTLPHVVQGTMSGVLDPAIISTTVAGEKAVFSLIATFRHTFVLGGTT